MGGRLAGKKERKLVALIGATSGRSAILAVKRARHGEAFWKHPLTMVSAASPSEGASGDSVPFDRRGCYESQRVVSRIVCRCLMGENIDSGLGMDQSRLSEDLILSVGTTSDADPRTTHGAQPLLFLLFFAGAGFTSLSPPTAFRFVPPVRSLFLVPSLASFGAARFFAPSLFFFDCSLSLLDSTFFPSFDGSSSSPTVSSFFSFSDFGSGAPFFGSFLLPASFSYPPPSASYSLLSFVAYQITLHQPLLVPTSVGEEGKAPSMQPIDPSRSHPCLADP